MSIVHRMNQINLLTVPNSKSHKTKSAVEHVQFYWECNNYGSEITGHCWQSSIPNGNADAPSRKVNALSCIVFYD